MYRLDDDLCQLVLSFLSFKDKVRLEGVCRQWQRLIYTDITQLDYPFYDPNDHHFWSSLSPEERLRISNIILRKCQSVCRLRVHSICDSSLLRMIADNCPQLHSIQLTFYSEPIDTQVMKDFAESCGKNLREFLMIGFLRIDGNSGLPFTSHPISNSLFLLSDNGLKILIQFNEFFVNLGAISFTIDSESTFKYFTQLADIYNQKIDSLTLRIRFSTDSAKVEECFKQITKFLNLKKLSVTLEIDEKFQLNLDSILQLMADNCQKLIGLSMEFKVSHSLPKHNVLKISSKLRTLYLRIKTQRMSSKSLQSLKCLNHLRDINLLCNSISDTDFTDIADRCPKLKSLTIKTMGDISDESLKSLSKLKYLEKLAIFAVPFKVQNITDSGVCQLITDCPNIKTIDFFCGIKITNTSIQKLKTLAKNRKQTIRFSFRWARTEEQYQQLPNLRENHTSADRFMSELKDLPKNLVIHSREYFTGWCGTSSLMEVQEYAEQFSYDMSDQSTLLDQRMSVAEFHTYRHI